MVIKPEVIPLDWIQPTEYEVEEESLASNNTHYDGTIASIRSIPGYMINSRFYPDNGNTRAVFLFQNGHEEFLAVIQPPDEFEEQYLLALGRNAQARGINSIADLANNIVSKRENASHAQVEQDLRDFLKI